MLHFFHGLVCNLSFTSCKYTKSALHFSLLPLSSSPVQNTVTYRPLHNLTLSPASLLLQLHFKLEDLHFEHHPTSSSTYSAQITDIPQQASLSSVREYFFQLLNQQWTTNIEILCLFVDEPSSISVTVTSKRTLVVDCLSVDADN